MSGSIYVVTVESGEEEFNRVHSNVRTGEPERYADHVRSEARRLGFDDPDGIAISWVKVADDR